MFTVIIAEKETIKLFEETKMFFGPLHNNERVAFCEWDKTADNFETMVPKLYSLIEFQDEWRAFILSDDGLTQQNPFDFVGYSEKFFSKKGDDWDYLRNRRLQRIEAYEKAVSNPLVKLTTALCGFSTANTVLEPETYNAIITGETQPYEYMLSKQLSELNCVEMAVRFDKFQRDSLTKFVADEKIDLLITCIKNSDVSGIIELIPDTDILDFIRFIGNDPRYYDPEYMECLIENTKKLELLETIAKRYSIKDKLPSEVICFSPRTFDFEKVKQDIKWKQKDEISSSRFANYNLYSDKLKFILFDILQEDNKQFKFDQIKFIGLMLVISSNGVPNGVVTANNVYRAEIDFNSEIISNICEKYISKLKATQILLKDIEQQLDYDNPSSIDDRTARRLFESDVHVPVKMSLENDETELYAEYKDLGLSKDCPEDEEVLWKTQYRKISKHFVRYLREPRRAVKRAVSEELRENNFIDDDRTLILTENQIEDINFHLAEEEQKLVETQTTQLFDTKRFTERLHQADKEVKLGIAQRMSKKKTVCVGLIAIVAYLVGFLPLLFGNINTSKSFLFSLGVMGVVLGVFTLIGLIYLFILRSRLVKLIKHFNAVMASICSEVNAALVRFSQYISHACNIMRDFSALKKRDSNVAKSKKVLLYHNTKISMQIAAIAEMFSKYVDFDNINIKDCKPYEFDFSLLRDYQYEMPSIYAIKRIEYLQPGTEIVVPIDYIESIKLTREELYD